MTDAYLPFPPEFLPYLFWFFVVIVLAIPTYCTFFITWHMIDPDGFKKFREFKNRIRTKIQNNK